MLVRQSSNHTSTPWQQGREHGTLVELYGCSELLFWLFLIFCFTPNRIINYNLLLLSYLQQPLEGFHTSKETVCLYIWILMVIIISSRILQNTEREITQKYCSSHRFHAHSRLLFSSCLSNQWRPSLLLSFLSLSPLSFSLSLSVSYTLESRLVHSAPCGDVQLISKTSLTVTRLGLCVDGKGQSLRHLQPWL